MRIVLLVFLLAFLEDHAAAWCHTQCLRSQFGHLTTLCAMPSVCVKDVQAPFQATWRVGGWVGGWVSVDVHNVSTVHLCVGYHAFVPGYTQARLGSRPHRVGGLPASKASPFSDTPEPWLPLLDTFQPCCGGSGLGVRCCSRWSRSNRFPRADCHRPSIIISAEPCPDALAAIFSGPALGPHGCLVDAPHPEIPPPPTPALSEAASGSEPTAEAATRGLVRLAILGHRHLELQSMQLSERPERVNAPLVAPAAGPAWRLTHRLPNQHECSCADPRKTRGSWCHVLSRALAAVAYHNDLRSWQELLMLPQSVLCPPPRAGRKHRKSCLHHAGRASAALGVSALPSPPRLWTALF